MQNPAGSGFPATPHPFAAQIVVAAGSLSAKEKEKEIIPQPLSDAERFWVYKYATTYFSNFPHIF